MRISALSHPALLDLRSKFQAHGRDIWAVGGCVRDALAGLPCKDEDFATDADPDEQKVIYDASGIYCIPTGLHHGTWTVRLDGESFEITSFRTETDHDGRWATTHFTRDIRADLGRRDLTINAMAMSFDGVLVDPFGGQDDLKAGIVRFVGDSGERMREDYLRMLRFLRFHARFAKREPLLDKALQDALVANAPGLRTISRERVWNEMGKIVVGPHADRMFGWCHQFGMAAHIDLPHAGENVRGGFPATSIEDAQADTRDKITLMVAYLGSVEAVMKIAADWKWSSRERAQGRLIAERLMGDTSLTALKLRAAVHGEPIDWLSEVARLLGRSEDAAKLEKWSVPEFPVTGQDLIAQGIPQGREMGRILHILKAEWGESGYRLTADSLRKKASMEFAS